MEPGHALTAETLKIVRNVTLRFAKKSEGHLLPLETILRIVEKFIVRRDTLPATIQQIGDTFGWTVRKADHEKNSYPDRIDVPLETVPGVEGAYLVMYDGRVVEIVIPLISYAASPFRMSEEKEAFIADAFVEVCRSVRMFLGPRDEAEPGKYPTMWWYPFSMLAVAVDRSYDNVELRLLDINEMYYREEFDRGLAELDREMGYGPPPLDALFVPLTVENWDKLKKRLIKELIQLEVGSHLIIRHRTTKMSLELMQTSDRKGKIDILYCELEHLAGPEGAWITSKDEQYLREMDWMLFERNDKKYWFESLVWPELLQTIQATGEELVEILRRQGAEQPTDLELNACNRRKNVKLELRSLTG